MTGKGHFSKEERNKELFNDFASGIYTGNQLAEKYHITRARVYAIANAIKRDVLPRPDDQD